MDNFRPEWITEKLSKTGRSIKRKFWPRDTGHIHVTIPEVKSTAAEPFLIRRAVRRQLLVTAMTTMLAGCAQALAPRPIVTPTPTPPFALGRTATLYLDGTVPSALDKAVIQPISGVAGIPDVTTVPSLNPLPDLILTFGELPVGYTGAAIGTSPITTITHLRVPIDSITADQARALLSGTVTDWNAVGTPYSLPVHLIALQGLALPSGVPLACNVQTVATADALAERGACPGRKLGACSSGIG